MICTEVAGMKRILVKIVLPVSLLYVTKQTGSMYSFTGFWSAVPMDCGKCA